MVKSKVAIVTGAGSGLGLEIANRLQGKGYTVIGCDRRINAGLSFTCENIDVTDESQVKDFIKRIAKENGRIDLLINNAGYATRIQSIKEINRKEIDVSFQTNVYGPIYFMREVTPLMEKEGSGKIINIASKTSVYPNPFLAIYSASKSALLSMTQAVAKEFREKKINIKCFVISPAGMKTEMREKVYGKESMANQMDPGLVADMVVELALNGTVPPHTEVPHGANIIIKGGKAIVKPMEDG